MPPFLSPLKATTRKLAEGFRSLSLEPFNLDFPNMLGEKTKQTFCIPLQKDQKTPRNPGQSWYPKTRNPSLAAGKVLLHVTAVHDVDRSLGHSLIRFESSVIPFHVKFLYSWHFISHPKCSCQAEWNRISTQNDVLLMTADLDLYQYSTAIYINTSVPLGVLFFFHLSPSSGDPPWPHLAF